VKESLDRKAPRSAGLMRAIGRLFWIERAVKRRGEKRGLERRELDALRADVRRRRSARALARIRKLVDHLLEDPPILPKSLLGKAVGYIASQWDPLTRFVEDPALAIHNNDSERALRHIVVGRKNWLFFASPRGGEVGANLFSLVATCKALGIHPEAYIEDVLRRVDTTPASEIASLTPWAWRQPPKLRRSRTSSPATTASRSSGPGQPVEPWDDRTGTPSSPSARAARASPRQFS
jgi:hypothetical protein